MEISGVIKDPDSKAILNTDRNKLAAYKSMKYAKKIENDRITKLENDVKEIKELLLKFINSNRL